MSERDVEKLQSDTVVQRFNQFLFDDNFNANSVDDDIIKILTAEKFDDFLDIVVESCIDEEPSIIRAIQRMASVTEVEFIEPNTHEDELTRNAIRAESEISSFIEDNSSQLSVNLLNKEEILQIEEIYNLNNMLAFAKELHTRKNGDLEVTEIDMILRYRNIIHRLNERMQIIRLAEIATANEDRDQKIGARTWGGYLHPYGFEDDGRIDTTEFRTSVGIKDDLGVDIAEIQGVKIKIAEGRHEVL